MGISNDKMGYISKDDLNLNRKEQQKKAEIKTRRRNYSTHLKENPLLLKNIKSQIDHKYINDKIEEEEYLDDNKNIIKNNKIFKSLSYEKLEKIDEPNKNANQNVDDNLYEGNKSDSNDSDANKQTYEDEKEEDIYNDMDNDNSIEEESDLNSNSNSQSNKELQIIDQNMKSLFLNSSKAVIDKKEIKANITNSTLNEDKKNKDKIISSISSSSIQESATEYELNYYRTGEAIRNSYIQKLVSKALYLPQNRPKTHNSLIIFDWDDTLLPTTFLTQGGAFNENIILTESDKKKIEKLENSAFNLLNIAITKGDVYIITNAGLGWVEYSAERFYPKVLEILPKIKIISARGEWEKDYPGDSRKWKIQSFLSLQKRLDTKLVTNIICLGDSLFEIEAGRVLANCFGEAFVKTIKFKEGPKLEELNKQLMLVLNQFNSIYLAVKNLTIRVEKKKKGQ